MEGLAWLESNDVTLINVSMAGPDNRVLATVIKRLIDRGTPVVAAVGNEGPAAPVLYPAGYPEVIGVTAVNQHRKIYRWANRGEQVDFAAPGVDVAVALTDGQYGSQSGTSLAAPVVSAQLACALASTSLENALAQLTRRADDLATRAVTRCSVTACCPTPTDTDQNSARRFSDATVSSYSAESSSNDNRCIQSGPR